jgi:hypothetical protein
MHDGIRPETRGDPPSNQVLQLTRLLFRMFNWKLEIYLGIDLIITFKIKLTNF